MLFVFDVLEADGVDARAYPLIERKDVLRRVIAEPRRIRPAGYFEKDGLSLFRTAAEIGFEGVVAKRSDSPYKRGRSFDWIKIKTSVGRRIDEERAKWNEKPEASDQTGGRKRGGRFGRGR